MIRRLQVLNSCGYNNDQNIKDTDIGIKVAATEMEVIMVDMGVIEVKGAIENSEVIIAKVDIAENRVEVMATSK